MIAVEPIDSKRNAAWWETIGAPLPPWIEKERDGNEGMEPGKIKYSGFPDLTRAICLRLIMIYGTPLRPLIFAFRTWLTNTSSGVLLSMVQIYSKDPPY